MKAYILPRATIPASFGQIILEGEPADLVEFFKLRELSESEALAKALTAQAPRHRPPGTKGLKLKRRDYAALAKRYVSASKGSLPPKSMSQFLRVNGGDSVKILKRHVRGLRAAESRKRKHVASKHLPSPFPKRDGLTELETERKRVKGVASGGPYA